MGVLEWKEEYSVGIEEMDKQHLKLLEIVNEFHEISKTRDFERISTILDKLRLYTVEHFESEEDYMRRAGYNRLDEHIEQHKDLVEKLEEFEYQYQSQEHIYSDQFMAFLIDWLVEHIMDSDMDYIESMKQAGLR